MITVFIRAIIVYTVTVVIFRLMGKRQIGEMEPYELVITLIIAEVVCVPMGDKSIPISTGITSAVTLFILHQLTVLLTRSGKFQRMISGKPIIVIDKEGINYRNLTEMNMRASDLLQAMRSAGCFSLEEVNYALVETNGQLAVIKNPDFDGKYQGEFPVPVITDGEWPFEELNDRIDREKIVKELRKRRVKLKDVIVMTVDGENHAVLQVKGKPYEVFDFPCKVVTVEAPLSERTSAQNENESQCQASNASQSDNASKIDNENQEQNASQAVKTLHENRTDNENQVALTEQEVQITSENRTPYDNKTENESRNTAESQTAYENETDNANQVALTDGKPKNAKKRRKVKGGRK